jgi:WD40 repeat protein/V8-like Glu-specific endopeptidase/energy-coupling factor transporter ATP-binding protein EcfA2
MTAPYTRPVAAILDREGQVVGTGCLVFRRSILTCAHVVNAALGEEPDAAARPDGPVTVNLPFLNKTGLKARVVVWYPMRPMADLVRDPVADIAVLELEEEVGFDGGLQREAIDRRPQVKGQPIVTYGFPDGFDNGVEASGEVLVEDPGGWLHVRDTQGFGYFIEPGFSGAPVFSPANGPSRPPRLIGMASMADRETETRLAFILPSKLLCRAWPLLARPYRGLFAFTEEDADLFFGRSTFVSELQAKLEHHPFAAVVGPSGSGKSSVVLAGLVPRMQHNGWQVAICRPQRDPLREVAWGLVSLLDLPPDASQDKSERAEKWADRLRADPGSIIDIVREATGSDGRALLVIDQFEELFTNDAEAPDGALARPEQTTLEHGSPRQAQLLRVLEAIAAQDPDTAVIRAAATLRADFMGQALKIGSLAALLRDTDVKLGPMMAADLAEAVRKPAEVFGVGFEDGLAEELVVAMQGRPGGLPLLQFALERLWVEQKDRRLTWAAYRGHDGRGGLERTLNDHAEAVLARLKRHRDYGTEAEDRLRRIMLRLVRLGEEASGTPDARAVARRSEIRPEDWPLVPKLADERSRLLTIGRDLATGEETVEVVHEALITAWERLRTWLEEDRAFGLWRQRLQPSLHQWEADPHETLLRGRQLAEARNWLASHGIQLTDRERAFIDESQKVKQREAETELRKARRRNRVLASIVVALLLVLAGGGYFYIEAQKATVRAEMAAREAKGRQLGAEALTIMRELPGASAAERAAALAVEGWRRYPGSSAYEAATELLKTLPSIQITHDDSVTAVALSADGSLLATGSADGTARLIRTADGNEVGRIAHDGFVRDVAFSGDGSLLATGSWDYTARLIRTTDGNEIGRIVHDAELWTVALSADGSLLATGSRDGTARLIRIADGSEIVRIALGGTVHKVVFSADGSLLAIASSDGTARLMRTQDGLEVARLALQGSVYAVAFSANGSLLATGGDDRTARLIRTVDGHQVTRIDHDDGVTAVALSADGSLLATVSTDGTAAGTVRLIRTADGSDIARFEHHDRVQAFELSADGSLLATGSDDGTVQLIRPADGREIARFANGDSVQNIAISADGSLLATGSWDGIARLIHTDEGLEIGTFAEDNGISSVILSADGSLLAIRNFDHIARLIRTADGNEIARIAPDSGVTTLSISADGSLLATGRHDGTVGLLRTADGSEIVGIAPDGGVNDLSISADGSLLVATSFDGDVRFISTEDGSEIAHFSDDNRFYIVALSANGSVLATKSVDGTVRLISTADGSEIARFAGDDTLQPAALDADGSLLAIGSVDGITRLIRTEDGNEIARIEHGSAISTLAFSPNSRLLATGSKDGTAKLTWTADGSEAGRVKHNDSIMNVAFRSDGSVLTTSSTLTNATVRLWLTPEQAIEKLCAERAGRNLSSDEWVRYVGPIETWAPTCLEWRTEDPQLLASWHGRSFSSIEVESE